MAQDTKPAGWVIRASGNTDDPAAHHELLERLGSVLSDQSYGCGSSEFTSAHVTEMNFHAAPAAVEDSGTGAAVSDTAIERTGQGYPSASPGAL